MAISAEYLISSALISDRSDLLFKGSHFSNIARQVGSIGLQAVEVIKFWSKSLVGVDLSNNQSKIYSSQAVQNLTKLIAAMHKSVGK